MSGGATQQEMGAVLPCGMPASKAIPEQGKEQPTTPVQTFLLQVHVHCENVSVPDARVIIGGKRIVTNAQGTADFGRKEAGSFSAEVSFSARDDHKSLTDPVQIQLNADTLKEVEVEKAKKVILELGIENKEEEEIQETVEIEFELDEPEIETIEPVELEFEIDEPDVEEIEPVELEFELDEPEIEEVEPVELEFELEEVDVENIEPVELEFEFVE